MSPATERPDTCFFFDFSRFTLPTEDLPDIAPDPKVTLATDWDTLHSQALPAERTAWLVNKLGFTGRANHYVGALWFYELVPQAFGFASATVTFSGAPNFSYTVQIQITIDGQATTIAHQIIVTDTLETLAKAFALLINNGFTGLRAESSGATLTLVYARAMGSSGNSDLLSTNIVPASPPAPMETLIITTSGSSFSGGADGQWRTDLTVIPRIQSHRLRTGAGRTSPAQQNHAVSTRQPRSVWNFRTATPIRR